MKYLISGRFVDLEKLRKLMDARDIVNKMIDDKIGEYPTMHCKICGDTNPKQGFSPILSGCAGTTPRETSFVICNRCSHTDEEYEKFFKESKEII